MKRTKQNAFDKWLESMVQDHKDAMKTGTWDGQAMSPYFQACKRFHNPLGLSSICTRDVGYHTSGWWKSPDYERCVHLSLAFFNPFTRQPAAQDHNIAGRIVKAMFFPHAKWVLAEPPYGDSGKQHDVWHYRLFCDERWQPIKPRGEVYSTELTEAGWKSFSDVQDAIAKFGQNPNVSQ